MPANSNILRDLLELEASILVHSADDVEQHASPYVKVEVRVDTLHLSISDHFDDGERILIVANEHADAIREEKRSEEGSRVDDEDFWDPQDKAAREEAESQGERPEDPVATDELRYRVEDHQTCAVA